ncbi:hypothetical protein [Clostridium botulinum]|nr:hypothetical protein [Clostridium botulinum]MBY6838831.1 hypothetical protein [Clostridium botulinum]
MKKVFVTKNNEFIKITYDGKSLLIKKENEQFKELTNLTKDEIKEWYLKL